jgi:signal transduction histidine kinase
VRRVIQSLKRRIALYWPRLRLRTIIFGTLLLVAALPGFGAIFLRVYENALVRRTEAELVAQGAVLSASAEMIWPDRSARAATPPPPLPPRKSEWVSSRSRRDVTASLGPSYDIRPTEVDLSTAPILPTRPTARPLASRPNATAQRVADRLAPVIAETQVDTLASIRLTDARGILLNGDQRGRSLAHVGEVARALRGNTVTVLRENESGIRDTPLAWISRASIVRLHYARPIRVDDRIVGVVLVSRTPPPLLRGMIEDAGKIVLAVMLILGTLIILTGILSRAIVRPIETLSRATRGVAAGRSHIPGDPSLKVVEIETLYADFRRMADAIAHRSRYLRDFAASLSHEFKTPLSGITGGIELIEDHGAEMSGEERARFLANMRGDADRLNRLLGRLMDLAHADMRVADGAARCNAAAVLANVADGFRRQDFAVMIGVAEDMAVAIDAETLATIAAVLIENAKQAGAASITVSASAGGDDISMTFADTGPGIPPADAVRIFDTFFTSKRTSGGTGLGLAIARSLAEAAGGSLDLESGEGGAVFMLTLPLAPS